jgi:RNA 2',3'-cyclic 3'-phosphodiesterase
MLSSFPTPSFKVGLVGKFNECLFLPERHPNVVAWNVSWFDESEALVAFQKTLAQWLQQHGFMAEEKRAWLPHVTLCRKPFNSKQWQRAFSELPFMTKHIHLYESLGNLQYESRWQYSFKPSFEEIEHTADLAFLVRGETLEQLYRHALIALTFRFPSLLSFFSDAKEKNNLEDIVMELNEVVAKADESIGCPFKAISFHGELVEEEDKTIRWEMIIDV